MQIFNTNIFDYNKSNLYFQAKSLHAYKAVWNFNMKCLLISYIKKNDVKLLQKVQMEILHFEKGCGISKYRLFLKFHNKNRCITSVKNSNRNSTSLNSVSFLMARLCYNSTLFSHNTCSESIFNIIGFILMLK